MQLTSKTLIDGKPLPTVNAMGIAAAGGAAQPGPNRSPQLAWTDVPSGTRSFAITCVDKDAPTKPDDVNQPGRTVPYDLPRADFVHWVLVDITESTKELREGLDADGVTPHGKPPGPTDHGVRGLNDYTGWFKGDAQFEGQYAGYDGPWPPWNDERRHQYVFTVYALDVPSLNLSGTFGFADAQGAINGHILAQASLKVSYAIYEKAR
jgi:Raf kinase inhibitor-like YbhB/YbcL family protein